MKKIILTALIILGATCYGGKVYAINIYTQLERNGEIQVWTSPESIVGSFTTDGNSHPVGIGEDGLQFEFKNESGYCHTVPHFQLLATTSNTSIGDAIESEAIVATDTNWTFFDTNWADNGTFLPNTTYYVWAYVNCGAVGGNMYLRSEATNTNFTGVIAADNTFSEILIQNKTTIYYIDPSGGETVATSSSNDIYIDYYLTEEDYIADSFIRLKYVRQEDLNGAVANTDLLWKTLDFNDTILDGYHSISTTTGSFGADGTYLVQVELRKPDTWWSTALSWINPFTSRDPNIITSSSTVFIYGGKTWYEQFWEESEAAIHNMLNPGTGSTTAEIMQDACNPVGGNFNIIVCFAGIIVPTGNEVINIASSTFSQIKYKFPLGYVNELVDIFQNDATSTLTVIDAKMPAALGLGEATIHLDLYGVLDPFLNATTSIFLNESATDNRTFYEITSEYWEKIVYLLAFLYTVARILGTAQFGYTYIDASNKSRNLTISRNIGFKLKSTRISSRNRTDIKIK